MPELIAGAGPVLLLCDHASNAIPPGVDLGIDPALLGRHIAVDIGAGPLTRALARRLGAPAILGTVSRLVVDLHRPPDHPGLIPIVSDGHVVAGNEGADRFARIARFYRPYHAAITRQIVAQRPRLIVAIHSFTPCLEAGDGTPRPWQVGILSNRDRRAAGPALAWLRDHAVVTGDNEPYSGRALNLTLNRHSEARGIASLSVEVRNDIIGAPDGVEHWADIVSDMVDHVRNSLARKVHLAT